MSRPAAITVAHPDVLRAAVEAAIQAPSSHNSQPWRFRIVDHVLELFADPDRHLRVIDGERRQQIVSCGCALYNARVAVRALGFVDEVTVMLAEPEHPDLLATLHLGAPHISTDADLALMAAIARRRTNRRAFGARPVAAQISDRLIAAAAAEGVTLVRLVPDEKRQVGALINQADRLQYGDPAFRTEIAHWLTSTVSLRRDGIPFSEKEYGAGATLPFSVMRALRSPDLGGEFGTLEQELVAGAPVVVVLGTRTDDPTDWLACGQALEAVLLLATSLGLSAAFLNQVIEVPALRGQLAALLPAVGAPQLVLRIGIPEEVVHHASPRRRIEDVLQIG
ncbi:MAG: nitroreductase family protein [Myxococcota bacterium]|nr:nitroreductase family protein [Myxococcota bacterium]